MLDYHSDYKILEPTTDLDARRSYWAVGIGLQKIDGVDTSDYLNALAEDTLKGKYSIEEVVLGGLSVRYAAGHEVTLLRQIRFSG